MRPAGQQRLVGVATQQAPLIRITAARMRDSHSWDIAITAEAPNYSVRS